MSSKQHDSPSSTDEAIDNLAAAGLDPRRVRDEWSGPPHRPGRSGRSSDHPQRCEHAWPGEPLPHTLCLKGCGTEYVECSEPEDLSGGPR